MKIRASTPGPVGPKPQKRQTLRRTKSPAVTKSGDGSLAVGAAFTGLIAVLAASALAAAVYGERTRDGSGEIACAITTCSPRALALCGLAFSLIPAVWCIVYAVSFRRLQTVGRILGAGFTVLLFLAVLMYSPSRRGYDELTTTEHGRQFALGMGWGILALLADFILLVPALALAWAKWGRRMPKAVWIVVLATPFALAAVAAAQR